MGAPPEGGLSGFQPQIRPTNFASSLMPSRLLFSLSAKRLSMSLTSAIHRTIRIGVQPAFGPAQLEIPNAPHASENNNSIALFRKSCLSPAIPPQREGRCARSSRHARRGSGGREGSRAGSKEHADEGSLADVKSQRPDTPMLVSRAMRKHCREWWPESPAHQGDCV
jgi:hypothetical protein